MDRNIKSELVILKSWPIKDHHRGLKGLSPTLGMISMIQFGSQSRKRGKGNSAEPFSYGIAQLYHDPQRNSWQIKDFEMIHSFANSGLSLKRVYIQSLFAETLLVSHQLGGAYKEGSGLLLESLSMLENAGVSDNAYMDRILVYYILKFLGILGKGDFFRRCSICGSVIELEEAVFCSSSGIHSCSRCSGVNTFQIMPGARRFLNLLDLQGASTLNRISLAPEIQTSLKEWLLLYLQHSLERGLKTIKTGRGVL